MKKVASLAVAFALMAAQALAATSLAPLETAPIEERQTWCGTYVEQVMAARDTSGLEAWEIDASYRNDYADCVDDPPGYERAHPLPLSSSAR